ncbi:MAG: hypothetical protein IPM21_08840 [Acidobacteria bacterium]|nr:hypothetical protein [Acidobacteriota bacterium]
MNRPPTDSVASKLRNRIWLAVCVLATLNAVVGLVGLAAATYIFSSFEIPFIGTIIVAAAITAAYGRWLADDAVQPIEKTLLAAKSLERNPNADIPGATGAAETDEILESIRRNGRQLRNLLKLMEDVASGNTNAALEPFEYSDRVTASAQKLIAKVTGSVDAGGELEQLRAAIERLSKDLAPANSGSPVQEIVAAGPLSELARPVNALRTQLEESRRDLAGAIAASEHLASQLAERTATARGKSATGKGVLDESIARLRSPLAPRPELDDSLAMLRAMSCDPKVLELGRNSTNGLKAGVDGLSLHVGELHRTIRELRENSLSIQNLARQSDEFARKLKLIALNASVGGSRTNGQAVADELIEMAEKIGRFSIESGNSLRVHSERITESDSLLQRIETGAATLGEEAREFSEVAASIVPLLSVTSKLPEMIGSLVAERSAERSDLLKRLTAMHFELAGLVGELDSLDSNIRESRTAVLRSKPRPIETAAPLPMPALPPSAPVETGEAAMEPAEYNGQHRESLPTASFEETHSPADMLELPQENALIQ